MGYQWAHIWACPPSEGDDYIFHCHPAEQKVPKPKRLQDWYKKMLDKGIIERVVIDYKDIHKDAIENGMKTPLDIPYFEGDFWPNVLEECIKGVFKDLKKNLISVIIRDLKNTFSLSLDLRIGTRRREEA